MHAWPVRFAIAFLLAVLVLAACSPPATVREPAVFTETVLQETLPPSPAIPTEERTEPAWSCDRVAISNPAATYCSLLGYSYETVDTANGQSTECIFPDGSRCDAWLFYAGACGAEFSYCARNGYTTQSASDGKDPFSFSYAVCVDAQGKQVGSVSSLIGLSDLLSECQ